MRDLVLAARLDISESLRARWFILYALIFGGLVVVLFMFGVTESRIMGFTGLSRLLIAYIQMCMAILPVFVLITTVRSVAGDREAGVFEYLLSLPVPLFAWFWGKSIGRFMVVFLPVFGAMILAALWGLVRGLDVPWEAVGFYGLLLVSLAWCFLGIGMLVSSLARSVDVAQGTAFMVWLVLLLFLDLILLGVMTRGQMPPETIIAISLINPMQVFRTAAMLLFDPELMLLGPAAYVILDAFGRIGYMVFSIVYPLLLGTACAAAGYGVFRRGDLP
ncbi:MAG: ABC transporter permease [Rhodospirillales bacterium]|nr:ABC transporter permease [Rhodospirillales bacterium]MCW8860995.1 ABC transporter permease [Rhodospirillales bacterium]MCW8969980.1 ABC transporter permease [Rhodospirillales bacterium]